MVFDFVDEVFAMCRNGMVGYKELFRNIFRRFSICEQRNDFFLPVSQFSTR